MIVFKNNSNEKPFKKFRNYYELAYKQKQNLVQAVAISSFDEVSQQVHSRYVNLKIVDDKKFIFFTNYNSPKAKQFSNNKNVSALFFWDVINTQIRILGKIEKTSRKFNIDYFNRRNIKKNALSISSKQSNPIHSFDEVKNKYNKILESHDLQKCPKYWGGFYFEPLSFEFWQGDDNR